MNIRLLFLLLGILFIGCGANEHKEYRIFPTPPMVQATVGASSFLILRVELPRGHHIYGNPKGPGTGKPTEIIITAVQGIQIKPAQFLPASKFIDPDYDFTWGYSHETSFFIPFTIMPSAVPGDYTIPITVDTLLCNEGSCIPKAFALDPVITVVAADGLNHAWDQASLDAFNRSAPPKAQPELIITPAKRNVRSSIAVKETDNDQLAAVSFSPRTIDEGITGILQAIFFSLIAGFILNFMPCVLPVASLKIMHFVKHADRNRRDVTILGLLFVAGIMTSFIVLASLAAFLGYNWGGLFQHRNYIIIMAGLIFALGLSFFGVYSITPPSIAGKLDTGKRGLYADAYIKGLIATLLATPCSGPFLGGALAWALTKPAAVIFAIFIAIGIGMASPYLLLILRPTLIKRIPKPGNWMHTIEGGMAFLLMFTVVYLISILDQASILPMIALLAFIGVAFWQYGRYGDIGRDRWKRVVSITVLIVIIAGGYLFSFHYAFNNTERNLLPRTVFSEKRLLQNRDKGVVSMVNFTADWCPNCRLVERVTLHQPAIAKILASRGIDVMTADITRAHPSADRLMKRLNSRSIPLLVFFPAGSDFSKPICLRDIYSTDDIVKALELAGSGKNETSPVQPQYQFKIETQ